MENYGKELIIDIQEADITNMNEADIRRYFDELCKEINMVQCGVHFWEEEYISKEEWNNSPHLRGVSAVQFIKTSSIVVHAIYGLKKFFVNIFSCKDFDDKKALEVTLKYFNGKVVTNQSLIRQ